MWQTSHPIFLSVQRDRDIRDVLKSNPLLYCIGDPSVLVPPSAPTLWRHDGPPQLEDFVQLPMHLWIPEFFLPHLCPTLPCPENGCCGKTARRRWHSGGPRLIHGTVSAVYLHCWEYSCEKHPSKSFSGWDQRCLSKLPPAVTAHFPFMLTAEDGVTLELYRRVVEARASGWSLHALRRELERNRYDRMFRMIALYNSECERYRLQPGTTGGYLSLTQWMSGQGAPHVDDDFPPILHNPLGYYDHEPPSVNYLSDLTNRHCSNRMELWTRHAQQLTGDLVCVDSTWKIAKRLNKADSAGRCLWSMLDIETGCILHQQLLTHEAHSDVSPMLKQYVARSLALGRPLPSRVCSDRGLMDARVINGPDAFPHAHINVDPWHFEQLFNKTLCKENSVWKDVQRAFSAALYTSRQSENGQSVQAHAEPDAIIRAVDALLKKFSQTGGDGNKAAVTAATVEWWNNQKHNVLVNRICSNPLNTNAPVCISSSPLENYHRQLNRLARFVRCTEDTLHSFLMQLMFRWNVDRRRTPKAGKKPLEPNWRTYDLVLVDAAFQSAVRAHGQEKAAALWGVRAVLPPEPVNREYFGLRHPHITLSERITKADFRLPFADEAMDALVDDISTHVSPIRDNDLAYLIRTTPGPGVGNIGKIFQSHRHADVARSTTGNDVTLQPISANNSVCDSTVSESTWSSASSSQCSTQPQSSVISSLLPSSHLSLAAAAPAQPRASVHRLTLEEHAILGRIILRDAVMREAVRDCHWDMAAARWNSFVHRCLAERRLSDSLRGALHLTVGEALQHAVGVLEKQRTLAAEHAVLDLKSTLGPAWRQLSLHEQPFTAHETTLLIDSIRAHKAKPVKGRSRSGRIPWMQVESTWLRTWQSETTAGVANHVFPRSIATLKSHWQTVSKREGQSDEDSDEATTAVPSLAAPPLAPLSESFSSPAPDSVEDTAGGVIEEGRSTVLIGPGSIGSVAGGLARLQQLGEGIGQFLWPPSPPSPSHPRSPLSDAPSPPSSPLPTSTVPSSTGGHWSKGETSRFNQLCKEHKYRWTYPEFCRVWPTAEFPRVSYMRWLGKNRIERRKRLKAEKAAASAASLAASAAEAQEQMIRGRERAATLRAEEELRNGGRGMRRKTPSTPAAE
jgi:hypothetical protein